jgi:hypothetical protein
MIAGVHIGLYSRVLDKIRSKSKAAGISHVQYARNFFLNVSPLTLTCYYLLIILLRELFNYGNNCLDYTATVIDEWMSVQL